MQTSHRSPFLTIHTEGALLPVDLLQRILASDKSLEGLTPESYHLSGEKLNEAINRAWNRLQGAWAAFQTSRSRLKDGEPGTTLTRERWLLPLIQELGYGRLLTAKAIEIEGKSYPISHSWGPAEAPVPIHLVGCGVDIEKRQVGVSGATKASPHSMMQEMLNRDEARHWGMVSNGLRLRVLRDNASLTRQAYLEFDLEAMFSGEVYADFAVLWLVCHQSRLEGGKPEDQWLERWSKVAQEQGTRALDSLRKGVEEAIIALGQGFLVHPANQVLRQQLKSGELNRQQYFRQLLRLVYRLIFLFVAEDRDLLLLPDAGSAARERYLKYYSTARLRRLAERQRGGRHSDLWQSFKLLTDLLAGNLPGSQEIGLPVLGGFLFSHNALPELEEAQVDNQALLNAVRSLAFMQEKNSRRAVDYKNLGSEELGSVYESLLELQPVLNVEPGTFQLTTVAGNERKTTGSYYTAAALIKITLDSALDPVILQAIQRAGNSIEMQIAALLALKICDPACGSGHFLIAAASRLARRIAQLRSGDEEPSPSVIRHALRDVIARCIYGVDLNPMAVELCKVNLWLEAIEPGKPLTFLDAHIQCGDSLVGVGPGLDITEIPDEAFNPAFGDDKATATALKKRNKRERGGQLGFRWQVTELKSAEDMARWRAERAGRVEAMPEDQPAQVLAKAQAYADYQQTQEYIQNRLEYDLWTAAFFWPIPKGDGEYMLAPTQQDLLALRSGKRPDARLVEQVREMAERLNFFHWELAFPQVFAGENPGFDCVLGNPPWERIKLQEGEFFAARDPEISAAPNKAVRQKLVDALSHTNLALANAFTNAKHAAECASKFSRKSGRFPLTAIGDINTYPLFANLATCLISKSGILGVIVPTGVATADTTKLFFDSLVRQRRIISIYDFLEARDFFIGLESRDPFCLFTVGGESVQVETADFVFKMLALSDIGEKARHVRLSPSEFSLFNPNTGTVPMFRTQVDATLTKKIYENAIVIENEKTVQNEWLIQFNRMFDMSNDSHHFIPAKEKTINDVRLYEQDLIHQYDHRFSFYPDGVTRVISEISDHQNPEPIATQYFLNSALVSSSLSERNWRQKWMLGYRRSVRSNDSRTFILSVIPFAGVSDSIFLVFPRYEEKTVGLIGNFNSLVFDYVTRQKIGGANLSFYIVKQLPTLSPNSYSPTDIAYIGSRVLELVYTAYDLKPFAEDMGYQGEPFRWDEERRAVLRAELDAYYARLYGLNRKQLRYILDPADLTRGEMEDILDPWEEVSDPLDMQGYGRRRAESDFPGETFRVLKEKEFKQYGEYRTRQLVLEAWDRLDGGRGG